MILFLEYLSFSLIIILNFLQTPYGDQIEIPQLCSPFSCGNISTSYPFRLRGDPKHCGVPGCELECTDDVAFLSLQSQPYDRYLVQAINYNNYTIRLADYSIRDNYLDNDTICSFPERSISKYTFAHPHSYPYSLYSGRFHNSTTRGITFISCPHPENSSLVFETTDCFNESSKKTYRYISFGDEFAMCRFDVLAMISMPLQRGNITLSDIHRALLYGFELSWLNALCPAKCKYECLLDADDGTTPKCLHQLECSFHLHDYWRIDCYGKAPDWFYNSLPRFNLILRTIGALVEFYLAGRILIGETCILGLLIYKLRRRHLSRFDAIEEFLLSNNNLMPIRYSYSNIKQMTGNLKEKLGEGGYGSVYKEKLRSGHDVAVKILNNKPGANGQDFINEIATIGRIHHINVVKLVGYCVEGSKCALIYNFMPKGSLEKYIYRDERPSNSLSWEQKYKVALGVARGIEYLHRGCDIQILHFDIKAHNILLDYSFTPKVSDFGLAKFYPTDYVTVTVTMARGTIGYVAPELISGIIGRISNKADVYSYGMLLMEMLGLNRDIVADDGKSSQYFPYWIYDRFNKGRDIEIGNTDEVDDEAARKMKRMLTIVGLWCIRTSTEDRPSKNEVVKMLEGENENMEIPPMPSQSGYGDQSGGIEPTDSPALLGTCNASIGVQL